MISFSVKGEPVATNHGYKHVLIRGRPRTALTDAANWYKAVLAQAARRAMRRAGLAPLEEGVVLAVRFVFPTLGWDIDGPVKFVQDALGNGSRNHPGAGLVVNDTRIRELHVVKANCDGTPRTEIAIAGPGEGCCPACGCACQTLLAAARGSR